MITTALLLPLFLLQDPQASSLDELAAAAATKPPQAIVALADTEGPQLSESDLAALPTRVATAEGASLLLFARLSAYGDDSRGAARLVTLLSASDNEQASGHDWAMAALATMRLPALAGDPDLAPALNLWLNEQVATDDPALWAEAEYTLYRVGDTSSRRAALRSLRSAANGIEEELRRQAVLALGRAGVPLGADELETLTRIANGLGADAVLAQALLDEDAQRQRSREKIEALQQLYQQGAAATTAHAEGLEVLDEVLRRIRLQHMEGEKYTDEELAGAAAEGMLRSLDPHSTYFSGEAYGEFMFDMTQAYGGIGAYVNTIDNVFTIVRPIYSGPAYAAGLLSGDKVLEVDGWSTAERPNDEVIKRLKGEPGTTVELLVFRNGWTEPKKFTIERARITLPVLQTEMLPGRILYMELLDFSADVGQRIATTIGDALAEGPVHGVVLDLRNNPGGYLSEAVDICDVFLPRGKVVVTTKSRMGADRSYRTRLPALVPESVPLSILINEFSASASEIVSGALSVHGRAVTVGERSYGKGSVQNIFPLDSHPDEPFEDKNGNYQHDEWEAYEDLNGNGKYDYGPHIKLTIAYYYLPDGSSIHTLRDHDGRVVQAGGVVPDREVGFPELDFVTARELNRLLAEDPFKPYAQSIYDQDKELAVRLAVNDLHRTQDYPGFDAFYQGLDTRLDKQEVRRWVRRSLRSIVSDARGKVFPGNGFFGDYVEDPQLREAIKVVLSASDVDYASLPEYAELLARKG